MKVHQLRIFLCDLKSHPECQEARKDLEVLDSILQDVDDMDVQELCRKIGTALAKDARAKSLAKGAAPLNEAEVKRYVDELTSLREDNAAFEAIVKRAEKDKSIKLTEAREIARRFTGDARKPRTKREAFDAVLERQITDKRNSARQSRISDLF